MRMYKVTSGGDGYMIMDDFKKKKNDKSSSDEVKVKDQVEYENFRKPKVEYSEVTIGDSPHYMPMTGTLPKDNKKKTEYADIKFNN